MGAAVAKIHRGFFGLDNKFGQIIARAEPGQDAIAFPSPGDDFLAGEIGGEMPMALLRKFFNAAMQTVIIPAERNKNPFLAFWHWINDKQGRRKYQYKNGTKSRYGAEFSNSGKSKLNRSKQRNRDLNHEMTRKKEVRAFAL